MNKHKQRVKKAKDLPLVEITWLDASVDTDQELRLNEDPSGFGHLFVCRSIGYLIRKSRSEVVLAMSCSDEDDTARFSHTIPKAWIKNIRHLTYEPICSAPAATTEPTASCETVTTEGSSA